MPKYVVSRTLQRADWNNSTILRGEVPAEVGALRDADGGDILVDVKPLHSGTLILTYHRP